MSGPSNTPPSTTSTNKRTRVSAEDSVMDVDKPLTPPGPVETTSAEIPSQPDTSSLDASQHAPATNNDKGKSPEITPAVSFPERAASPDASQAAVQSQPTLFYASAASNDVDGFWNHFASNRDACDVCFTEPRLYLGRPLWRTLFANLPATFSPDQRAERRAYVALLAGLPRGTISVDLAEIADEISAKSINVPFSMNSYNPKPYAYCHFASETAMENAKSISCALKKVGLTWHSPDEVTSLCHRCGRPNCNPDRCASTSFSSC
ncbi:hypothetical protein GLOIN_2v1785090 [Rhizophagus irregularis DAOM 181602=DAOM 197198]|nr:hypothetical protein GLOIN_2v1785090 [Rhizophagus irregularis DAOM 181602=DAOM 197198]